MEPRAWRGHAIPGRSVQGDRYCLMYTMGYDMADNMGQENGATYDTSPTDTRNKMAVREGRIMRRVYMLLFARAREPRKRPGPLERPVYSSDFVRTLDHALAGESASVPPTVWPGYARGARAPCAGNGVAGGAGAGAGAAACASNGSRSCAGGGACPVPTAPK